MNVANKFLITQKQQTRKGNTSMQTRISHLIIAVTAAAAMAALATGCASTKSGGAAKEERVSVAQMSAPARTTVEKVTAGGKVDQVDKEVERGKVVYDVEATVGGKHVE